MSFWEKLPGRPLDEQVFAIGDIHGQASALEAALGRIRDTERSGAPTHLVFLGDVIDRGPENLRATDLVLNASELSGVDKVTFLPGNHELMFLDALQHPHDRIAMNWAVNGGMKVMEEVCAPGTIHGTSADEIIVLLKNRLAGFIEMIDAAPNHLRLGDLVFVHAGVDPDTPLEQFLAKTRDSHTLGRQEHWAWIREPFLYHMGGWDKEGAIVVVHGHTPHANRIIPSEGAGTYLDHVENKKRICLDAGAASMGQVAFLEIREDSYRIDVAHEKKLELDLQPSIEMLF